VRALRIVVVALLTYSLVMGLPSFYSWAATLINLATQVKGVLPEANGGTGQTSSTIQYLTADATGSTSNTLATSGMTYSLAASTVYTMQCEMMFTVSATSAVGFTFGVAGPGTPTEVTIHMLNQTTQTAMRSEWSQTATWGAKVGATATTFNTNPVRAEINGLIENGTTAGTLTIQFANIGTTGTTTLKRGSWCKVQPQ
jgi:hypothetical protein